MRKQICVLALVLLTGCGAPETVQSAPNTSDLEAAVEIPAAAALYQDAPLPEVWEEQVNAVERSTYIADLAFAPSLEEGIRRADAVVRASVIGYENVLLGDEQYPTPWTIVSLAVSECLRGDVQAGEHVQMYAMEGWSLGADGVALYRAFRFGGLPVKNKEYILCMSKADGILPEDAYKRLCGRHGMLQILDDGETLAYVRYEEPPEKVYTIKMKELLDRIDT